MVTLNKDMNSQKNIICIIPARGGSKGVPRKNLREILGKPLIAYTIEAALNSGVIDRVLVSTEDAEISDVAREFGAEVIVRPIELAGDKVTLEPVIVDVLEQLEKKESYIPDLISLIQPTSPLLKSEVIKKSVLKVLNNECDSCITAFTPETYEWKWSISQEGSADSEFLLPEVPVTHRVVRQDLPKVLHENGAFYVTRTELFLKHGHRWGGRVGAVQMTEEDSVQIDSEFQLWFIEQILKRRKENK